MFLHASLFIFEIHFQSLSRCSSNAFLADCWAEFVMHRLLLSRLSFYAFLADSRENVALVKTHSNVANFIICLTGLNKFFFK